MRQRPRTRTKVSKDTNTCLARKTGEAGLKARSQKGGLTQSPRYGSREEENNQLNQD